MGLFTYHFVSLDQEQLLRRRELLDGYGQFAQLSALVPLFTIILLRFFIFLEEKYSFSDLRKSRKEHASPVVTRFAETAAAARKQGWSEVVWGRVQWWLDDEVVSGWGTWREWVVGGSWAVWLMVLAMRDTGDGMSDFISLLDAMSPLSPITLITRLSHEELNPYHRILGRILLCFFALHASFYLNFYIQSSLLLKRIKDRDVILGLTAITTLLTLGTTALQKVREKNYYFFFVAHVILSISVLPVLWFHVSHLRVYIAESGVVYLLLILQRNITQTPVLATVSPVLGTENLLSVTATVPASSSLAKRLRKSKPGQHIYLALATRRSPPQDKFRINPFTIASGPSSSYTHEGGSGSGKLNLVIRSLSGTTARLLARSNDETSLMIEGPYGAAATSFPNFLADGFASVLLVAGGVGATFTVPIYADLVARVAGSHPAPDNDKVNVRFVWAVRSLADTAWAAEESVRGSEIYVTAAGGGGGASRNRSREQQGEEEEQFVVKAPDEEEGGEAIELQEQARLLSEPPEAAGDQGSGGATANLASQRVLRNGRPDFRTIVAEVFAGSGGGGDGKKTAVLVCGPKAMSKSLRREVAMWVRKGREVWWHEEGFGW
ncbi:MAG: hypothetical protein Q9167_004634 [Letrouitia subvulpina]